MFVQRRIPIGVCFRRNRAITTNGRSVCVSVPKENLNESKAIIRTKGVDGESG